MLSRILTIFFFLLSALAWSQETNEKVISLTYQITQNHLANNTFILKSELLLDNKSYYYSIVDVVDEPVNVRMIGPKDYYDYHIGSRSNLIDFNMVSTMGKSYEIVDSLTPINWKIQKAVKQKIQGYDCIRAMGNYRGRMIEAFFTEEIPVNIGPHKLNGLPGAIVYAKSHDGVYEFVMQSATKIDRPGKFIDYDFQSFGNLITLKEYLENISYIGRGILEEEKKRMEKAVSRLPKGMIASGPEVSIANTSLELYYEWQLERD